MQVTGQTAAWEPCIACQLQERGLYDPIAHAFTLRYNTGKGSSPVKAKPSVRTSTSKILLTSGVAPEETAAEAAGVNNPDDEVSEPADNAAKVDDLTDKAAEVDAPEGEVAEVHDPDVENVVPAADVQELPKVDGVKEEAAALDGNDQDDETSETVKAQLVFSDAEQSPMSNRANSSFSSITQSPTSGYGTDGEWTQRIFGVVAACVLRPIATGRSRPYSCT